MHRVRMLQHFGVTPFLIFDGDYLPSKAATEKDRAVRRADSRKAGLELLKAGKTSQAFLELQKAVDVTPEMARQLIDELKRTGVQYIVAPYEADAQMAYLEKQGVIDAILSEDSDLLVFGSKCLLTKLDQYGNCIEINRADFCACREITLTGWSDAEFRRMAILSGCDYLASISNMGLKTAYRMVRKHKTIDKVIRMLQFDGKYHVPKDYLEAFHKAELTFLHQRVFCPKALTLVLHTVPERPIDETKLPFIGADVEPTIAQGVARGDLNPMTKAPIVVGQKMISTLTPWSTPRPQFQPRRTVASDNIKKGTPIESFFKPKRIPLAELDPNCFTPSPTQQATLQRNSGAWQANEAPRPYLNRAATDSQNVTHSAPQQSRTIARQINAGPVHISEPRPVKRARLCAENDSPVKDSSQLARSRFFASDISDPSPTFGRHAKSRLSKKSDITIFSDDSIDEALLGMPDFGSTSESIKGDGLAERRTTEACYTDSQVAIFESTRQEIFTTAHLTGPMLTQSASTLTSGTEDHAPDLGTAQLQDLRDKFGFQQKGTSTPTSFSNSQAMPTPPSSIAPKPSRIPLANKTNISLAESSALPIKTLTPLQRLGASATNRKQFLPTPPITPTIMTPVSTITKPRSLLSRMPFPNVQTSQKLSNPASIPLPQPDEAENRALVGTGENGGKGSEDLIIPDSDEDECLSPCSTIGEGKSALNLAQFVYAG